MDKNRESKGKNINCNGKIMWKQSTEKIKMNKTIDYEP
jgi:hypothetical protein